MSDRIWFTSDEHFGHANIIQFCNRPFKDTVEMQEALIDRHNEVVKAGDRVYHLGDMYWRSTSEEQALAIRYRLNGQHYYIYGNHDEVFHKSQRVRESFIWCKERFNLKVPGYPNIVLDHFAMETWNGSHKGAYQLFGHEHAARSMDVISGLKLEVGVDCWNYYPVSFETVTEILGRKAEATVHKFWSCNNVECKHRFNAVDKEPKICAKCGSTMKLMSRFEEARP